MAYSGERLRHLAEEALGDLYGFVGAEVTERVLEMLLDPARQLQTLVRATEPLQTNTPCKITSYAFPEIFGTKSTAL